MNDTELLVPWLIATSERIARRLGYPDKQVEEIITEYVDYQQDELGVMCDNCGHQTIGYDLKRRKEEE